MSRIINPNDPGKLRNAARRTIAEILRHLMFKRTLDEETMDMSAALVFALREIAASIDVTVEAWEKRNYFLKADRFRLEWEWAGPAAERLQEIVMLGRWEELPAQLAALAPRFKDIRIAKMTRDASVWKSSYALLMQGK